MTTAASDPQIVPQSPPSAPALRAADQGVADALEAVLSENTQRVYQTQWSFSTIGVATWVSDPCRRNRSPSRVTWPPARVPAPASHLASGHQRHRQGP